MENKASPDREKALISAYKAEEKDRTENVRRDHQFKLGIEHRDHQRRLEDIQIDFAQSLSLITEICQIRIEGVVAAGRGASIGKNPYTPEGVRWNEWRRGWTDAKHEQRPE